MLFCSPDHPIIGSPDSSASTAYSALLPTVSTACTANLLRIMNDDFRAALVSDNVAPNLHPLPLQRFQVAKLVFVGSEDHAGKRAGAIVLTEIQEGVPCTGGINSQDKPGNAAAFAHQRPGIANIHTGRRATRGGRIRGAGGLQGQRSTALITGLRLNREPTPTPSPKATSRSPVTTRIGLRFIAPHTPAASALCTRRCGRPASKTAVYQKGGASAGALFKCQRVLHLLAPWWVNPLAASANKAVGKDDGTVSVGSDPRGKLSYGGTAVLAATALPSRACCGSQTYGTPLPQVPPLQGRQRGISPEPRQLVSFRRTCG